MNKWIINGKEKLEVYLSSNGIIMVEDLIGSSISGIDFKKVGIKTIISLLCGCLWEKNKLTLEETANLFDQLLDNNLYTVSELSVILGDEIKKWSSKLNNDSNDKKK